MSKCEILNCNNPSMDGFYHCVQHQQEWGTKVEAMIRGTNEDDHELSAFEKATLMAQDELKGFGRAVELVKQMRRQRTAPEPLYIELLESFRVDILKIVNEWVNDENAPPTGDCGPELWPVRDGITCAEEIKALHRKYFVNKIK